MIAVFLIFVFLAGVFVITFDQMKDVYVLLGRVIRKTADSFKGTDITDHFGVSLSTVNRTIRQLRKEGLIEYSGSKKTGGYHAIEPPTA